VSCVLHSLSLTYLFQGVLSLAELFVDVGFLIFLSSGVQCWLLSVYLYSEATRHHWGSFLKIPDLMDQ